MFIYTENSILNFILILQKVKKYLMMNDSTKVFTIFHYQIIIFHSIFIMPLTCLLWTVHYNRNHRLLYKWTVHYNRNHRLLYKWTVHYNRNHRLLYKWTVHGRLVLIRQHHNGLKFKLFQYTSTKLK